MCGMSSDMSDESVAALAVFGIFIMPIIGWIVVRMLSHRERIEMIRNGMVPPGKMSGRAWREASAASQQMGTVTPGPSRRKGWCDADVSVESERIILRKGIRLTFIGLALTIGLSFIGYSDGTFGPTWHPGPWLLGGLIPMFIGLAQVTSAMLAGATFGYVANGNGNGSGAVPPPYGEPFVAPHAAPPTYDGSYTYRPGDTQELRPPPHPPERF